MKARDWISVAAFMILRSIMTVLSTMLVELFRYVYDYFYVNSLSDFLYCASFQVLIM